MTHGWGTSTRRKRRPPNWKQLREEQLERDGHRCTAVEGGVRCTATTNLEVDHLEEMSDDHSRLQTLCRRHHAQKTNRFNHHARRKAIAKAKKRADKLWGHDEHHSGSGIPHKHPWMR